MWLEVRHALRQLTKQKSLSAVIILLLGLGIGASATIFQFVNALMLRTLPVRSPRELFLIEKMRTRQVRPDTACFYRVYEQIRSRTDLFSSAIAVQQWTESSFQPLTSGDSVKIVSTEIVSPNYFTDLSVTAMQGRCLTAADADTTSDIPAVVSYQFWASQMNRDRNAVGRTLRIKNFPFRVVGVLPSRFHGIDIDRSPDIRLPISAATILAKRNVFDLGSVDFEVLVRVKDGYAPSAAAAAITAPMKDADAVLGRAMLTRQSGGSSAGRSAQQTEEMVQFFMDYQVRLVNVAKGLSRMREQFATALYVLFAGSALLFIAVCASVAGLIVAHFERRRRELAIRMAAGASRRRLVRHILLDILALALPGMFLAWALAIALGPKLLRLLPKVRGLTPIYPTEQVVDLSWDSRSVLVLLLFCLVAMALSGIGPVSRTFRLDISGILKCNQEAAARTRVGVFIVATQILLCVVLLYDAALMFRTFWSLKHLDPGFDRKHIVEVDVNPAAVGYSPIQTHQFLEQIRGELAVLPGVRSVAAAMMGVMRGVGMKATMAPEGVTLPKNTFANVNINMVTPEYFGALGIPLLAGRIFDPADRTAQPEPVVINKAFADLFFPHTNPIGRRLAPGADGKLRPTMTIIGMVGTAKYRSLREESPPIVYRMESESFPARILYARTINDPEALVGPITKLMAAQNARIPIISISSLEQEVENSLWQERLVTLVSGLFALIAVGLAAAGIYGTLTYYVATQTRAIAIRIALGAELGDLFRSLCGSLIIAMLIGLFAGGVSALALARFGRALVFGVQDVAPATLFIAALCVLGIALLAAIAPVARAVRTDSAVIIRSE